MIGLFGAGNRLRLQLVRDALNPSYQISLMHSGGSNTADFTKKAAPKGKTRLQVAGFVPANGNIDTTSGSLTCSVPGRATPPSFSPATTTHSNLGLELSPRLRSSKIVIRKPPRRLHPWHRNRNCKSKTSASDRTRCRRCKNPGG